MKLNNTDSIDLQKLIETRLLVQANSGGGKSWLIRRILEQTHGKVQQIVLDPEGEFGTLREKYDYVLVGKDGDIPADPKTAALLAIRLLETKASAIIDLYELSPNDRKRFVRLFVDSMVNAPKNLYHEVLVILDEAHIFVPEKEQSEAAGAVKDLCTRGRKRGFCAVLATQRISKLAKDVAAECNNKLIGRTSLDIDIKRAGEELGFTSREQLQSLRRLKPGEFYGFGPAIADDVKEIVIGEVTTSHPKVGSRTLTHTPPPTAAIKRMLSQFGDLPEVAQKEASTSAELRTENAKLKIRLGQLEKSSGVQVDKEAIRIAVAAKEKELLDGFTAEIEQYKSQANELQGKLNQIGEILGAEVKALPAITKLPKPQAHVAIQTVPISPAKEMTGDMGKGEAVLLRAIAPFEGCSREHITILTGYKRSTRDAYIQRLQQRGFVRAALGKIHITSEGVAAIGGNIELPKTGEDLRQHYLNTLPKGEASVLEVVMNAYPNAISRDDISEATAFQRSTRDAYIQRLSTRLLVEVNRGEVKASNNLFV